MYPDLLQHIERLQAELARVESCGETLRVADAVARIAADLRAPQQQSVAKVAHRHG